MVVFAGKVRTHYQSLDHRVRHPARPQFFLTASMVNLEEIEPSVSATCLPKFWTERESNPYLRNANAVLYH